MRKITVSIVLYKHSKQFLEPLLNVLLKCDDVFTIYLINNGYCEWVNDLSGGKIHGISGHGNIGYGRGHNLAIAKLTESNSTYHIICNPDIVIMEDTIKKILQYAEQNNFGLLMPKILYPSGEVQQLCKLLPTPIDLILRRFIPNLAKYSNYVIDASHLEIPVCIPSLSGCFMFTRTSCLVDCKGFDERFFMYLEDVDLSRRLFNKYGSIFNPNFLVVHNFEKSSYKNLKMFIFHMISAIKYFNKWGWIFDKERKITNEIILKDIKKHNHV